MVQVDPGAGCPCRTTTCESCYVLQVTFGGSAPSIGGVAELAQEQRHVHVTRARDREGHQHLGVEPIGAARGEVTPESKRR